MNTFNGSEKGFWEKCAETRWGRYIREVETRIVKSAHALAARPSTALDIGCDNGQLTKLLFDLGWEMACIDINARALVRCHKRIPQAKCALVDGNNTVLPYESASFGLVLCVEVPPVINSTWFMSEVFRVLHPGGVVVGVFSNLFSLRGSYHALVASLKGQTITYKMPYPNWRDKLYRAGFEMIDEVGLCWFPFRRDSDSRLVPVFTQLENYLGLRYLPGVSPWVVFLAQKKQSLQTQVSLPDYKVSNQS